MALDRWIALVFVAFCCVYGYAAFFTMDQLLPPFMQRNPVWPSTFPKILSVFGVIVGLVVLFGLEATEGSEPSPTDINWRRLHEYKLGQALALLGLMVLYAIALRPAGFLLSTTVFIAGGALILGERRWIAILVSAVAAAGIVWWLVDQVLGIFLRPLPNFL
ncbi:Tripartite tricarboxylate transporter TctB family protein [Rhodobacteraceae bacterium THAF1]|uniref:tripartite tricarboxylate transporter TctB family protein n=1 Tax=Palleronia sp. THAF1 TaxID=2587842 RepID=UPI000F3EFECD|nr:tripartite tricarboxylate transporter TctB family protein [Palleronia sp. THAF1]QFU09704.1 Tripartite tricarboxylate transporter TctB family protein [Palleronia sp. THAF1]VDC17393.1 Tripartite tricarboxylate transporter TctB family protein [Rhodobacteraceae bacterium THAF1]